MRKRKKTPLDAVVKIRELREQDSLLGFHAARVEMQRAAERQAALVQTIEDLTAETNPADDAVKSTSEWLADRARLSFLTGGLSSVTQLADEAVAVSDLAREHWQLDRQRLRAVEDLRDRRLAREAEERARVEAKNLDEMSQQIWTRNRHQQQEMIG